MPLLAGSCMIVKEEFLGLFVNAVNTRLRTNFARIDRLVEAVKKHYGWPRIGSLPQGGGTAALGVSAHNSLPLVIRDAPHALFWSSMFGSDAC